MTHLETSSTPKDWAWPFWPVVPIYPYGQRRTLVKEIIPETLWTFEQVQGIFYVVVPIRMTVIRLEEGGLFVYSPVAPTRECVRMMRQLEAKYGEVQAILLPTVSGIEHKVFVGPFARKFPQAQVYIAPDQWSFPVNLPLRWLGFPTKRTQILYQDKPYLPYTDQFDYAKLGPINLGLGAFEEIALFHKSSQTLLVTDTVISIPESPPEVVQLDPYPLLYHAKDDTFTQTQDTLANRQKGWQRIALFAMYFRPSALNVVSLGQSLKEALKAPDRSKKALFGWFPYQWTAQWYSSFTALRGGGRLLVAPILQQLILNRAASATLTWVEKVSRWPFQRVIPCHFEAPIITAPTQFSQAFDFLRSYSTLPETDLELLREIEEGLSQRGII